MQSRRASSDRGNFLNETANILPKSEKYLLEPFERDFQEQALLCLEIDTT